MRIDENWLLLMRLTVSLLMESTLPNNLRLLYRRGCQRTIDPEGALKVWVCHVGVLCQLLVVHLLRVILDHLDLVCILQMLFSSFLVYDLPGHV